MASFKKIGDWEKVAILAARLKYEMMIAQQKSLKRFGLKVEAITKTHMSTQDLNWAELSPDYLARKVRNGDSDNILIATNSYRQSVTSYVINDVVFVGVKKTVVDEEGNEIANIARVHEFGYEPNNIPARPLWQPSFDEALRWHGQNNTPDIYLRKQLKKYL